MDFSAELRGSGLGRRTAGRPKDRLGDRPTSVWLAPLPDSIRSDRKEVGPFFGVGLRRQRSVHAAGAFALREGSATVSVALFGVSPNRSCRHPIRHLMRKGERVRPVGGTPTGAIETIALPISLTARRRMPGPLLGGLGGGSVHVEEES